jgi:hypothetical protein
MAGCNCKKTRCFCLLDGEGGVTIEGNGSERNPYLPTWMRYTLLGSTTNQTTVTVTGDGSVGNPWVITITTEGGAITQTVYTSDDTWVKQAGGMAQIVAIGGGGGGGGVANPHAAAGGSGGGGGAMSVAWLALDELPDEVDLKVGQGGRGGKAVEGATTAESGGDSWFGTYLYAGGGRGGKSQAAPAQNQFRAVGGTPPDGGPGGMGSIRFGNTVIPADEHRNYLSPTGGGMGQGSAVAQSPGGLILAGRSWGGEGGAGGFSIGAQAQPGGDFGGGGGGGSASPLLLSAHPGADGAPGVVVVTVW